MFDRNNVRSLHLETSSVCNAACPMCARELDPNFDKKKDAVSLSLTQIKNLFDDEFIKKLEHMFMCGNYGDPAAAPDCIEIFKYFRTVNNTMSFGMNTNGSLRNVTWWRNLGAVLSKGGDKCYFGIDGLKDTNHIYRVNTFFDKIMKNAEAFISAGGQAHWEYLVFDYNEHQIEDARKLAMEMGFKGFKTKVSHRLYSPSTVHLRDKFNPPIGKEYQ